MSHGGVGEIEYFFEGRKMLKLISYAVSLVYICPGVEVTVS